MLANNLYKPVYLIVNSAYSKTKKVAMVSSRDAYQIVFKCKKESGTENKNRRLIISSKSKNMDDYPPVSGCVRIDTILSGFIFDEVKPGVMDCHFYAEADPKISLFIMKKVGPKNANYAYYLKQYLE